jgi:uncharacterized membrane protein
LVIALLYQILGCIGIVSPISQDTVTNYMMMVINLLAALGIIAEPARKKMQKKKKCNCNCKYKKR